MLKHEQQSNPLPAAQARVTPEELARALAAIEARKERDDRKTANTIPVGEALRELGFSAAPEDVLAEVMAQRAVNAAKNKQWTIPQRIAGVMLALAAGIGSLLSMTYFFPVRGTVYSGTATQNFNQPPQTVVKTLAEIPDDELFYCDDASAQKLIEQKAGPPSKVLVTEGTPRSYGTPNTQWTFSKGANTIYLNGYTALRSSAAMSLGHVPIFPIAVNDSGEGGLNYNTLISLPIGRFKLENTGVNIGGLQGIVVSDIHMDRDSAITQNPDK